MSTPPQRRNAARSRWPAWWISDTLARRPGPCAHIEELISDAADQRATPEQLGEIRAHTALCRSCRTTQAVVSSVRADLRSRPAAKMPPGLSDRLMAALEAEQNRELARSRRARLAWPAPRIAWASGVGVAAALAVALIAHVEHPTHGIVSHPLVAPTRIAAVPAPPNRSAEHTVAAPAHSAAPQRRPVAIAAFPDADSSNHGHAIPVRRPLSPAHPVVVAAAPEPAASRVFVKHVPAHTASPGASAGSPVVVATLPRVTQPTHEPNALSTPQAAPPVEHSQAPAPVVVAALPPSLPSQTTTAEYDSEPTHGHLLGALRLIARHSQQDTTQVATISLASMDRHAPYSGTVSMVSSSFR